jgi:hypothetical protein
VAASGLSPSPTASSRQTRCSTSWLEQSRDRRRFGLRFFLIAAIYNYNMERQPT